jgi:glycerol kinase
MSKGSPKVLTIDQSTSATKAVVFDIQGRLIDRYSVEHRPVYPKPGRVEHDAEELWRNTQSVIQSAAEKHRDFICLSITNQRETFVIFDRATGRPLHNAVVWQCRRGDEECARLSRNGHADLVSEKTGLKIDSYFSAPKLAALLRENPALRSKLQSGDALFGTIDTYLLYRLTNCKTFATDSTNASRTLLFNINTLTWDQELCDLFEIPIHALAEVRDSASRFGFCDNPSLPANLPIAGVMGDSQAALFGHRCFKPGQAKVTIGSGSSILLNAGPRVPLRGIRTIGWTYNGTATYCLEGIISYSGATITWLRDQLGIIQSADETEAAAAAVPNNGGVYLVPAFTGLAAPYWSPMARAAIVGLNASSTRDHVVRAALESIAYQIKDVLDNMAAEAHVAIGLIHADGGATRNKFLMQLIADITGANIMLPNSADFSPLGSALAGLLGIGLYTSAEQLAELPMEEHAFSPQMSCSVAAELCQGWENAVQKILAEP